MKKIYSLIVICASSAGLVIGQVAKMPYVEVSMNSSSVKPTSQPMSACDTLGEYVVRATAFNTLTAPGGGYVSLSNQYVTETGQHFTYSGAATVNKVLFVSGLAADIEQIGTADAHNVYIYAANPTDSFPLGAALGSASFVTSSILPYPAFNAVTFSTPVAVTGNFIASITGLDAVGKNDTVPLVFNGNGNGAGERRSMQKINPAVPTVGGTWMKMSDFWSAFDRDAMIIPVVNCPTGIDSYASSKGLTLKGTFPNPASDITTITYSIQQAQTVSVTVFDLSGRVIQESSSKQDSGDHTLNISVKDFAAGTYYYTLKTNEAQLTSEFSVVK